MRAICLAGIFAAFLATGAQAAELSVVSAGFVYNAGLQDLAAAFTRDTGIKVNVQHISMGGVVAQAKTAIPAPDLVVLPTEPYDLLGNFAKDGGIIEGSWTPLGRVEIVLAVKAGAPHPDISTVDKLVAVLKSSKTGILRSNPGNSPIPGVGSVEALVIDNVLKRPEFAGVKSVISTGSEGGEALTKGQGDMALQLVCEVYPFPEISSVGPLPPQLYAHMDAAIAISKRSTDEKDARAFIAYITRPEAIAVWKAHGLDRF